MSQIHVLVATTSRDLAAEVISAAVARCGSMRLLGGGVVAASDVEQLLTRLPPAAPCALVLVGGAADTAEMETRWLRRRKRLVVLRVDIVEDLVNLAAREVGLPALLAAVRDLARRAAALSSSFMGIGRRRLRLGPIAPAAAASPLPHPQSCIAPEG